MCVHACACFVLSHFVKIVEAEQKCLKYRRMEYALFGWKIHSMHMVRIFFGCRCYIDDGRVKEMVAIFGFNLHEAYLYVLKALGLKCLCSSLSFESFRAAQYSMLGNAGFKAHGLHACAAVWVLKAFELP